MPEERSLAREILLAEEMADRLVKKRLEKLEVKPSVVQQPSSTQVVAPAPVVRVEERRKKTHTLDKAGEPLKFRTNLIEVTGRGTLREITIRSPSNNFSVRIQADDSINLERTFQELLSLSSSVTWIDAFAEDGLVPPGIYTLHVSEINWSDSFSFTIIPKEPITFNNIFAVWDEYA